MFRERLWVLIKAVRSRAVYGALNCIELLNPWSRLFLPVLLATIYIYIYTCICAKVLSNAGSYNRAVWWRRWERSYGNRTHLSSNEDTLLWSYYSKVCKSSVKLHHNTGSLTQEHAKKCTIVDDEMPVLINNYNNLVYCATSSLLLLVVRYFC